MNPKRMSQILLFSFLALPFIGGLFDFVFRDHPNLYGAYSLGMALATACIMFAWYYHDAINIGYKRTVWLNIMVLAISIISLPYYFFRSRGFKRGVFYSLLFITILILYFLFAVAGTYVGDHFIHPALS